MGTPLSSGSYTATAFARHLSAPEPFPNPRRPSPSFGREYDRPGPAASHLDPRTRASVCGCPEIAEGFLWRFRLGLGLPDLVVDGGEPVGGTVPALVIVEGLAPVDNHSLCMDSITETIAGQHFPFQRREERLRGSIVETRPDPAHRLPNPQLPAQLGERVCGIGATAVGME